MNTEHTCAGCIWEDDCRAANTRCSGCSYYYNENIDFAYSAMMYCLDLDDRADQYMTLVREMQ